MQKYMSWGQLWKCDPFFPVTKTKQKSRAVTLKNQEKLQIVKDMKMKMLLFVHFNKL